MINPEDYKDIRPDVLNVDDIVTMVPRFKGYEWLVKALLHLLQVDKVNQVHGACCDTPGPEFVKRLLFEQFKVDLRVDGTEYLENLPKGAFITVSNHPFGAIDGITLIYLITRYRPEFRVMVNWILSKITAMRPNFISVDAWQSNDPAKRQVSVNGIRQAMRMLRDGEPIGFFPAGAMSKVNKRLRLQDREWQPTILQLIYKAKVPVVPIFFHGSNSWWFNFLGVTWWQARSLRLPAEVFRKKKIWVSVGEPISVEDQARFDSPKALGDYLRAKTYALRDNKKPSTSFCI